MPRVKIKNFGWAANRNQPVNPRSFFVKVEISPYVHSASELIHPALFLYLWFNSQDKELGWVRVNEEV